MKRGGLLALFLMLFFLLANSLSADEVTVNLQSRIVEDFDNPQDSPWIIRGSKFSSVIKTNAGDDVYPKSAFVKAWPAALFSKQPEGKELKTFGIHGKFDRKGYNFIELLPAKKGDDGKLVPRTLPLPGRVKNMDIWVWGSNYDYYLEAHIQDHKGISHVLTFGDIKFIGWKNISVNIPTNISQAVSYTPKLKGLELVKLVLWTKPNERVNDFYVYFDQLKIFTDLFESPFDGEALTNPDTIKELWADGSKK